MAWLDFNWKRVLKKKSLPASGTNMYQNDDKVPMIVTYQGMWNCSPHLTLPLRERWAAVVPCSGIKWWSNPPGPTLDAECQAVRQWVPFLTSLVWASQGLNPCSALKVKKLEWILKFTGNQWSDFKMGVMWDLLFVLLKGLAAEFCNTCRQISFFYLGMWAGLGLGLV